MFFASLQDELVTRHVPDARPPTAIEPDGRTADAGSRETVDHAQRVAEGVSLEIHRNTWRYNKLIELQRQAVLEQRDRVLRTDAALRALARQSPNRADALAATVPDEVLVDAARQITLWHLDRAWADHLSYLADLREGIHLRALGRGLNPLDEFHKEAVRAFSGLLAAVEERSVESFETVPITAAGADMNAAGLEAPHRHLDLPGARQPVRHRHRPRPAHRGPRDAPPAALLSSHAHSHPPRVVVMQRLK